MKEGDISAGQAVCRTEGTVAIGVGAMELARHPLGFVGGAVIGYFVTEALTPPSQRLEIGCPKKK